MDKEQVEMLYNKMGQRKTGIVENKRIEELVEQHYKVMRMGWLLGDARMGKHINPQEFEWLVDEAGKDYLSHPDLALICPSCRRNRNNEACSYCHGANYIPLAEALKEK